MTTARQRRQRAGVDHEDAAVEGGDEPGQQRTGRFDVERSGADQHGVGSGHQWAEHVGGLRAAVDGATGSLRECHDTALGDGHGQCRGGARRGGQPELAGPGPESRHPGQQHRSGRLPGTSDDQNLTPLLLVARPAVVGQRPATQLGRGDDDRIRERRGHSPPAPS
jgi:hypothetical protein